MRNVNPGDLEDLATLIDGRDGLGGRLGEAFTRASQLGVSSELTVLRPLTTWVSDTAPDLRKRAAIGRLEDGDPTAGLLAAGFTPEELENYNGEIAPGTLVLANSVAQSDDPKADEFDRQNGESLTDYITRLEAHALSKLPGLEAHEQTLAKVISIGGDVLTLTTVAGVVTFQGSSLVKTLGGNAFKQGWGKDLKEKGALRLRRSGIRKLVRAGRKIDAWSPPIRSLSAPGSWLPGRLGAWTATQSSTYQQVTRVPMTGGLLGDRWGNMYDAFRRNRFMDATWRGMSANRGIDLLVGSDYLAKSYGGRTHSGQLVARAGQANLLRVYRKARDAERFAQALNWSPATGGTRQFGLKTALKTSGGLRTFGIAGQAALTAYSAANVATQNPFKKFDSRKEGAGYVADVAELSFNTTLTAAMVAPTPITIGAAVGTGLVYGGAKVVEHWDGIKGGASKAANWTEGKAKDLGSGAVGKAKGFGKKLNPKKWL